MFLEPEEGVSAGLRVNESEDKFGNPNGKALGTWGCKLAGFDCGTLSVE